VRLAVADGRRARKASPATSGGSSCYQTRHLSVLAGRRCVCWMFRDVSEDGFAHGFDEGSPRDERHDASCIRCFNVASTLNVER
jgi:hypothetical protein